MPSAQAPGFKENNKARGSWSMVQGSECLVDPMELVKHQALCRACGSMSMHSSLPHLCLLPGTCPAVHGPGQASFARGVEQPGGECREGGGAKLSLMPWPRRVGVQPDMLSQDWAFGGKAKRPSHFLVPALALDSSAALPPVPPCSPGLGGPCSGPKPPWG